MCEDARKTALPSVLVVDDEPLIRWSLSEGLTDSGYRVRLAGNASEARAALSALEPPLVVVLDLRLPDSVGLGLLREIRARFPETPVVMMSAHGTSEDVQEARTLGACRFVEKPFDVTDMVRWVGEAWESRS